MKKQEQLHLDLLSEPSGSSWDLYEQQCRNLGYIGKRCLRDSKRHPHESKKTPSQEWVCNYGLEND